MDCTGFDLVSLFSSPLSFFLAFGFPARQTQFHYARLVNPHFNVELGTTFDKFDRCKD